MCVEDYFGVCVRYKMLGPVTDHLIEYTWAGVQECACLRSISGVSHMVILGKD